MFRALLIAALAAMVLTPVGCSEDPTFQDDALLMSQAARRLNTPSIRIVSPDAQLETVRVAPIFTIEWTAENAKSVRRILLDLADYDNDLDAALEYARSGDDEWSEWKRYKPHKGEGTGWHSPPVAPGWYLFAVEAKSPRGDVTDIVLGINAIRLIVLEAEPSPLLIVSNPYFQPIGSNGLDIPPTLVDIPSGAAMQFTLRAFAEHYGGTVEGYRFGWDITDVDDDSQWDIDFTPFPGETVETPPRTFFFGTHAFYAEIIDNFGFRSRVIIRLNVIPATMERQLLVVDDWVEGEGTFETTNGFHPSDAEDDAFWAQMTLDVAGFQPAIDVLELLPGEIPPLTELVRYRSIIWNASGAPGSGSVLGDIIRWNDDGIPHYGGGRITPNLVALYMAVGGHILICGEQVMVLSVGGFAPTFPILTRYKIVGDGGEIGLRGPGDNLFAYRDGCLNVLDAAYLTSGHPRNGGGICPVTGVRNYDPRTDGLRACDPMAAGGGFPRLELRPEVASPGRFFEESRAGVNCDIYNPPYFELLSPTCETLADYGRMCFQPIYGLQCIDQLSAVFGAPVGYWTGVYQNVFPEAGGVAARSAVWGFHPVYFQPDEVKTALDLILFDEWRLTRR